MKTPLLALALILSSLALGLQLKGARAAALFDKYPVPLRGASLLVAASYPH